MQLESLSHPYKELMWAVACTTFFGFFRLGQLLPESTKQDHVIAAILWSDMAKRTQLWSGFILGSPIVINLELEPTSSLGALVILSAKSQPLLTMGSRPGLFFQLPRARAVTKVLFVDQLRAILSAMGLPQHLYAGHSFHIGAATTAAMAGVDAMIQTLGRWRSASYVCAVCKDAKLSAVLARNAN